MDKKNIAIILLTASLVVVIGFFVYKTKKQQAKQEQLLRNLEYNAANVKGDNKGKPKDPCKDVAVNNSLRKKGKACIKHRLPEFKLISLINTISKDNRCNI